jgi:hypothetical protein
MRHLIVLSLAVLAALVPETGQAQLLYDRVEGLQRVCTYRDNFDPSRARETRTGIGSACPTFPPRSRSSLPAPPTARLLATQDDDSGRQCVYGEGSRRWTIETTVDRRCPLSAGILMKERQEDLRASGF